MKPISTAHHLLLTIALLFTAGCATRPDPGQHANWKHVTTVPDAKPPRGKVVSTEDGSVLTLPNGKKFISNVVADETKLAFPNRQVFSEETAKGGFQPPYVSTDESLVVSLLVPSTQSGDLYVYLVGQNGRYREVSDVNRKIGEVLRKAGAPFGAGALRILDLQGRTLFLASVDYGANFGEADLFKVHVSPDGTFSLRTLSSVAE